MATSGFDNRRHHITAMKIDKTNGAGIILSGTKDPFREGEQQTASIDKRTASVRQGVQASRSEVRRHEKLL